MLLDLLVFMVLGFRVFLVGQVCLESPVMKVRQVIQVILVFRIQVILAGLVIPLLEVRV